MLALVRSLFVLSTCFVSFARAEERDAPATPELNRLAPLIGNWKGSGSATFAPGAPATKWEARGTYREALGGNFLREDFEIRLEGRPVPLVTRAYLGFDRERKRYVQVRANNAGKCDLTDLTVLADGAASSIGIFDQGGVPFAERSAWRVEGDTLNLAVDLFLQSGPSVPVVNGKLARTDEAYEADFGAPAFEGAAPGEDLKRLARIEGTYDLRGTVVTAPGASPLTIRGVETFRSAFGGLVIVGTSNGSAEGFPGTHEGEVFWGFDARTGSITSVYATNSGDVGGSESRFTGEWNTLVSVHSGLRRGVPLSQRFVMHVDEKGAVKTVVGHTLLGDTPPLEGYQALYSKR